MPFSLKKCLHFISVYVKFETNMNGKFRGLSDRASGVWTAI